MQRFIVAVIRGNCWSIEPKSGTIQTTVQDCERAAISLSENTHNTKTRVYNTYFLWVKTHFLLKCEFFCVTLFFFLIDDPLHRNKTYPFPSSAISCHSGVNVYNSIDCADGVIMSQCPFSNYLSIPVHVFIRKCHPP